MVCVLSPEQIPNLLPLVCKATKRELGAMAIE